MFAISPAASTRLEAARVQALAAFNAAKEHSRKKCEVRDTDVEHCFITPLYPNRIGVKALFRDFEMKLTVSRNKDGIQLKVRHLKPPRRVYKESDPAVYHYLSCELGDQFCGYKIRSRIITDGKMVYDGNLGEHDSLDPPLKRLSLFRDCAEPVLLRLPSRFRRSFPVGLRLFEPPIPEYLNPERPFNSNAWIRVWVTPEELS